MVTLDGLYTQFRNENTDHELFVLSLFIFFVYISYFYQHPK